MPSVVRDGCRRGTRLSVVEGNADVLNDRREKERLFGSRGEGRE